MRRPAAGLLGLVLFVALFGLGSRWAVPHIEDTLRVDAEGALAGLPDGGTFQVDFDGRTAMLNSGTQDVTGAATESLLDVPGVRSVRVLGAEVDREAADKPGTTGEAKAINDDAADDDDAAGSSSTSEGSEEGGGSNIAAESTSEAPPEQTDNVIRVVLKDGTATLSGTVADEATRDRLLASLESASPPVRIDDELEVGGGEPDERIEAIVPLLGTLVDHLNSGTAELGSDELSILGTAKSRESLELVNRTITGARSDGLLVTGAVTAPAPSSADSDDSTGGENAGTLQQDLDSILTRARAEDPQSVQFGDRDSGLSGDSQAVLDRVISALSEHPDSSVQVRGHTNSIGSDLLNQRLSEQRAQVVVDYLVDNSVDESRLTAVGMGESEPLVSNNTEQGRQVNRRVDFVVDASGS